MEGPDFLSIGFDLPRREEEAIPAPCPVSQLHGEAVLDAELPKCPVPAHTAGLVEEAGARANLGADRS